MQAHTHKHTPKHSQILTNRYKQIHTRTHTHTHTHTHIHEQGIKRPNLKACPGSQQLSKHASSSHLSLLLYIARLGLLYTVLVCKFRVAIARILSGIDSLLRSLAAATRPLFSSAAQREENSRARVDAGQRSSFEPTSPSTATQKSHL